MFNVLQVGLGPLGKMIVSDCAARRICNVVAAVDLNPENIGKPLSEVVPGCGFGTRVAGSFNDIKNWGDGRWGENTIQVAIVSTASDLAACAPTLRELIKRRVPIVSTCEELLWPWLRHPALADELDALAKQHSVGLVGTGVNPGFMMDTLPVAATAVCRNVRSVHVWRIQDATPRRVPFQKKIGAGLNDAAFAARIQDGSLRHVGLGESLHFVAHYLGFKVDKWEETIEPVIADRDMTCAMGPIKKGLAAGVRQTARGWQKDANGVLEAEPRVVFEFQAAIGQTSPMPQDRVRIEAEPVIDLRIDGGVHGDVATTAITLNTVRSLLASGRPGLHTMATLPVTFALPRG